MPMTQNIDYQTDKLEPRIKTVHKIDAFSKKWKTKQVMISQIFYSKELLPVLEFVYFYRKIPPHGTVSHIYSRR